MQSKSIGAAAAIAVFAATAASPPHFGSWAPPVNLGADVNTPFAEVDPSVSKDGRSLYFSCLDCSDGFGGFDLYVSQRATQADAWGPLRNLGPTINTPFNETNPEPSDDGRLLFLTSNRPGGSGLTDLYVSKRHNKRDDFGWQEPQNLGAGVNTTANDRSAEYFEDERNGTVILYFASDRVSPPTNDIFMSVLRPDDSFGAAAIVQELSTPFDDGQPAIRKDGLELFMHSNRPGSIVNPNTGQPSLDLWVSTRSSTAHPWDAPTNLGPAVNHAFADTSPALSWDRRTLYFASAQRAGNISPFADIWSTTRSKVKMQKRNKRRSE